MIIIFYCKIVYIPYAYTLALSFTDNQYQVVRHDDIVFKYLFISTQYGVLINKDLNTMTQSYVYYIYTANLANICGPCIFKMFNIKQKEN